MGLAYRAARRYAQAVPAFERVVDNRYATFFDGFAYLWALSNYKLKIAHEALGDTEKAASAYERFLSVWNEADTGRGEVADAERRLEALKAN